MSESLAAVAPSSTSSVGSVMSFAPSLSASSALSTCPVCYVDYPSLLRSTGSATATGGSGAKAVRIKALHCGHSMCSLCVDRLVAPKCPMCRVGLPEDFKKTASVNFLAENFFRESMFESPSGETSATSGMQDSVDVKSSSVSGLLSPSAGFVKPEDRILRLMCRDHPDTKLSVYCIDCKQIVCCQCCQELFEGQHSKHKVKVWNLGKELSISKLIGAIEGEKKEMETVKLKLESVKRKVADDFMVFKLFLETWDIQQSEQISKIHAKIVELENSSKKILSSSDDVVVIVDEVIPNIVPVLESTAEGTLTEAAVESIFKIQSTLNSFSKIIEDYSKICKAPKTFCDSSRVDEKTEFPSELVTRPWRDFRPGDAVDALDGKSRWYESTIMDCKDGSVLVHFNGWSSQPDEWIGISSTRLAKFRTYSINFSVGTLVDAVDRWNKWHEATIVKVKSRMVLVSFNGWPSDRNEWISVDSERLAKAHMYTTGPYVFSPIDLVVNALVDVLGTRSQTWYESTILKLQDGKILVHYNGWASKHDEWIPIDSDRLARAHTYAAKGPFKSGSSGPEYP